MAFGLDLLMPLIENSSNTWGTGERAQEQARKDARYDYAENERAGIQARVEGAKAAGLHPLAALGFQAGAPSQVVGGEGTNLSGMSFGQSSRPDKATDDEMRAAQLRLLSAQADNQDAEAQAHRARTALATQPGQAPVYPTDPGNLPAGQGNYLPGVNVEPNKVISSVDGTEVGYQPTLARGRGSDGSTWHGLSDWGLKQTEDMELLRMGLFAYLNRDKLDRALTRAGLFDQFDRLMAAGIIPSGRNSHVDARDAQRFQDREDKLELIRLMNRSRAADRQRYRR